jgi:hypothetical protein
MGLGRMVASALWGPLCEGGGRSGCWKPVHTWSQTIATAGRWTPKVGLCEVHQLLKDRSILIDLLAEKRKGEVIPLHPRRAK